MIQESKLREEDRVVTVDGYEMLRKDRGKLVGVSRYSRGGGLVILIRKGLRYRQWEAGRGVEEARIEVMGVELFQNKERKLNLMNVYIPPEGRGIVDLEKLDLLPGREGGCSEYILYTILCIILCINLIILFYELIIVGTIYLPRAYLFDVFILINCCICSFG